MSIQQWKAKVRKEREKEEKLKKREEKATGEAKGENVCLNCVHAYLMQSSHNNPIVSECKLTKDRQVASMFVCTNGFEALSGRTPEIHEMITANLF